MKESLQNRCRLFVENRDRIKSEFKWETTYMYPLCAAMYTAEGIQADPSTMRACQKLLKQHTGVFSNFRRATMLSVVTKLSLSDDPEETVRGMLRVYGELKELFYGSPYLAIAAVTIAQLASPDRQTEIVQRTRTIYNRMKAVHPFLTSGEDSAFAALLALSGLDDLRIEEEMEACFNLLKPSFFSGDAVQSLSHILALGESTAQQKCGRVMALFDYLKDNGYRYGTSFELPTLGSLALLNPEVSEIGDQMISVDAYLKEHKGFGAWGIGSKQRLMYAGMLTMDEYLPAPSAIQTAAVSSVISLVIAQQAVLSAAIVTSAAASASSSSSN